MKIDSNSIARLPSNKATTTLSRSASVRSSSGTINNIDRFISQRTQFTGPLPSAWMISMPQINGMVLNSISHISARSVGRHSMKPRVLPMNDCQNTPTQVSPSTASLTVVRMPSCKVV